MKKWLLGLLVLMMLFTTALADPEVTRQGLKLGEGYVYYPQVEGLDDPAMQEGINTALQASTGAPELLTRLALTMHSPTPLQADYTCQVIGDVLSVALKASGPVTTDRPTQVWRTANIDLTTGHTITLDDLFTDTDAALLAISDWLEWELAPSLSAHLAASQLTPLPEHFTLSATGINLHYPLEQLATLSDQAGVINLQWCEILDHLNLEKDSILDRIGARGMLVSHDASGLNIRAQCESHQLPGIPVQLGGSVQEAVDTYGLLIDPDLYENGRLIQLEDGAFRGVYLLTDNLSEHFTTSVIQGIRSDRINLWGLMTGITTQSDWRSLLGEPDASVTIDDTKAEASRILPGCSDYYNFTGVQLRLHANEAGVLTSVFLTAN